MGLGWFGIANTVTSRLGHDPWVGTDVADKTFRIRRNGMEPGDIPGYLQTGNQTLYESITANPRLPGA